LSRSKFRMPRGLHIDFTFEVRLLGDQVALEGFELVDGDPEAISFRCWDVRKPIYSS